MPNIERKCQIRKRQIKKPNRITLICSMSTFKAIYHGFMGNCGMLVHYRSTIREDDHDHTHCCKFLKDEGFSFLRKNSFVYLLKKNCTMRVFGHAQRKNK